jgi:NADPH2:quinone reductase
MSYMRAVVVDPNAAGRLTIVLVPPPAPKPSEALVKVAAVSLNRGEVYRAQSADDGWRPGWDLAGIVERAAEDGTGPAAGARVVGFVGSGAWAELVAVPTNAIASLSHAVSFSVASTLPVAGLTALHALEKGGSLLGRNVLITGATGGVGHFGCQLARYMGAHITALVRHADRATLVREAGAHNVVVSDDPAATGDYGPFHHILESVGGASLAASLKQLTPGGMCVVYGTSAGSLAEFDATRFFATGGVTLYGFILFYELRRESAALGLARLLGLVEAGVVKPHVSLEAPWAEVGSVAQSFFNRSIPGKAVLIVE